MSIGVVTQMRREEYLKTKKKSTLKDLLNRYERDTITDLQVLRVLTPVLRMIVEGRFDKTRKPKKALITG